MKIGVGLRFIISDLPVCGSMHPRPELPADRRRPADVRLSTDHPRFDEIMRRHEEALAEGRPGYVDPATSLWVFTARYLWDRGTCCDTGCRHCPYVDR